MLRVGGAASLDVTGGALSQPNGKLIKSGGISSINFKDGTKSDGTFLPAQHLRATGSSEIIVVFPIR